MRRQPFRVSLCLSIGLLLAAVLPIAAQVYRQRTDLVVVDVSVVGPGARPVLDLSASDFQVLVDGTPRRVAAFRRLNRTPPADRVGAIPSAASEATAPSAGAAERLIVVVVQRDQIGPREGHDTLEAAAAFIESLPPEDLVAVWAIPAPAREIRTLPDRVAARRMLLELQGTAPRSDSMITLTPEEASAIAFMMNEETLQEVIARECGRLANAGPSCPDEVKLEARRRHQAIRSKADETLKELTHLVAAIEGFDGPKHVVLITTGPPQTPENAGSLDRLSQAAALARVHMHALQVQHLPQAVRAGEMGRPAPAVKQSLSLSYSLAANTGGVSITPSDPRVGFTELNSALSASYELGVETVASDRDGKPHRIEVRVPSRKALTIRARQQFTIAPPTATPTDATTPTREGVPAPPADPVEKPEPKTETDRSPLAASSPLLKQMGDYLVEFEREFSSAVVQERYVQLIRPVRGRPSWPSDELAIEWHEGKGVVSRTGQIFERKQLLSDVLLVHTRQGWIGYRDVAAVDGRTVRGRNERVSRLFLSKDADRTDQLRRIAAESARYNLGEFRRTMNIPTLPLSFLYPTNYTRFSFAAAGEEALEGRATRIVAFEEVARPTFIGTSSGQDVPLTGRLWVDPASGAVVQTEIAVYAGERRSMMVTRYRAEASFDVLVPDFMWEWYDAGRYLISGIGAAAIVECLARYSNYRRFQVNTSEKR